MEHTVKRVSLIRAWAALTVVLIVLAFQFTPAKADVTPGNGREVVLGGVIEADYDVAIARTLFMSIGYSVTFEKCPWARCLKLMETGEIDVLANVFITPEREKFMWYGYEPVFDFQQYFYVKADSSISYFGDFSSLSEYIIGIRGGFSYGDAFDNAIEEDGLQVYRANDSLNNVKLLLLGRLDLLVENPMNLIVELQEANELELMDGIRFLKPSLSHQPSYIPVSKKNWIGKRLVFEIDQALQDLKQNGIYQSILDDYFQGYKLE